MNVKLHYGDRFRLGKTKYFVSAADADALSILAEIRRDLPISPNRCWLLKHREQIRRIVANRPRAVLTYLALVCPDPALRRLAIWLRGLCGGTLGATLLYRLAWESDHEIHLLVARVFRRMGAWAQLRELAMRPGLSPNTAQVFRQPPREYTRRLKRFVEHTPTIQLPPDASRLSLMMAKGVRWGGGKPPKPIGQIRRILQRIHRLVSGT